MATIEIEGADDPNFLQLNDGNAEWDSPLLQQEDPIIKEYFNQIVGIGMALESLDDLKKVQDKVNQSTELDAPTLKIAKIAVENIVSNFNIDVVLPSLEGYSTKEAALEEINQTVKKIFAAIWSAIMKVINFFIELFTSKKEVDRKHQRIKTKQLIVNVINNKLQPKENVTTIRAIAALGLTSNEVSIHDLDIFTSHFNTTMKIVLKVQHEFQKFIVNLTNFVKIYSDMKEMSDEDQAKMDTSILDSITSWSSFFHSSMSPFTSNRNMYSDAIAQFKERRNLTSGQISKAHCFDGFLHGKCAVAAVVQSEKFDVDEVVFDVLSRDKSYDYADRFEMPDIGLLKNYSDGPLEEMQQVEEKLRQGFKSLADALNKLQPKTDSFIENHPSLKETEVTAYAGRLISTHLAVLSSISFLAVDTAKGLERITTAIAMQYK